MKKILILFDTNDQQKQLLKDDNHQVIFFKKDEVQPSDLKDANVIIGNVKLEMLDYCEKLEYLHLVVAGSDKYAAHPRIKDKVILTNSTGCFGLAISEHMLGNVLFFYKRFNQYYQNQQQAKYHSEGNVRSIFGASVLVIGLGDIGDNFARRMSLLGAEVTGIKRTVSPKPEYLKNLYQMDKLDECLNQADIIALSLPNTNETYHIINDKRLAHMKDDVLLINVGRGPAIDTQALIKHLTLRPSMSAALDVFEEEPLPKESELWHLSNVQITPHVSGGRNLSYTNDKLFQLAHDNLKAYLANTTLTNVVDFKTGYRRSDV